MELLERYLHAIRFWLPKAQSQDIIAELRSDILSQIEERESEHGRPLNEAEVAALLKQIGSPVTVAARYAPPRHLIGPVLFPVYSFVLKIVALCSVLPMLLFQLGSLGLNPGYRAQHGGDSWLGAFLFLCTSLVPTLLANGAVVTIIFALIERSHSRAFVDRWDPRKLPAVRDSQRISRASSTIEMIVNLVFCFWWIDLRAAFLHGSWPIQVDLAPGWTFYFWAYLLLAVANVVLIATRLRWPFWTRRRATLRLLTDAVGAALFCLLCRSGVLLGLHGSGITPEKAAVTVVLINNALATLFPFALLVGIAIVASGLWRIYRTNGTVHQTLAA